MQEIMYMIGQWKKKRKNKKKRTEKERVVQNACGEVFGWFNAPKEATIHSLSSPHEANPTKVSTWPYDFSLIFILFIYVAGAPYDYLPNPSTWGVKSFVNCHCSIFHHGPLIIFERIHVFFFVKYFPNLLFFPPLIFTVIL